jgi:hypothetical protein
VVRYHCYHIPLFRAGQVRYGPNDFDILAALIVPEDVWYIIPISAIRPHRKKTLVIHMPTSRAVGRGFDRFRERWDLFK